MLGLVEHIKTADKLINLLLNQSNSTILITEIRSVNYVYDEGTPKERARLIVAYLKDKPDLGEEVLKALGINKHLINEYSTLRQ